MAASSSLSSVVWESSVFTFQVCADLFARALFAVDFESGRFVVNQIDLSDSGVRWNSTPCRSFADSESAIAWASGEVSALSV